MIQKLFARRSLKAQATLLDVADLNLGIVFNTVHGQLEHVGANPNQIYGVFSKSMSYISTYIYEV